MVSGELRLQSMLRAMLEVIQPAIDPSRQLAIDQANIMIGTLRILLDQHDKTYQFRTAELRQYSALVRDLTDIAQGGSETHASARAAKALLAQVEAIAGLPIPSQAALTELVVAIRTAADELLRAAYADGTAAFRKAADRLVLDQAGKELLRERAWVRRAGFEADPSVLPPIEELLTDLDQGIATTRT